MPDGAYVALTPRAPSTEAVVSPWKRKLTWTKRVLKNALRYIEVYFEPRRWKPLAVPEINIENISICNSQCVFCPNGKMERPRQALKPDVFKKAVDEAISLGATVINFSVMIGDPLLDPHLMECARYVKSYPTVREMGFTTTLQWLHKFDLDDFFRCGFDWITVSTTLSGREPYHKFFGVDRYEEMLSNLVALLTENNKRNKPICIVLSLKPTPEPRKKILNHPDFLLVQSLTNQNLRKVIKREEFLVMDWGGAMTLPSYLRPYPLWPRRHRPCGRLLRNLMIYSNGKVGACNCVDFEATSELILGNVGDASLSEMWKGEVLKKIRSDWRSGKHIPSICAKCQMYRPGPLN
jgi:radical SAM protein with 4Fe4S-binding SPASM domain